MCVIPCLPLTSASSQGSMCVECAALAFSYKGSHVRASSFLNELSSQISTPQAAASLRLPAQTCKPVGSGHSWTWCQTRGWPFIDTDSAFTRSPSALLLRSWRSIQSTWHSRMTGLLRASASVSRSNRHNGTSTVRKRDSFIGLDVNTHAWVFVLMSWHLSRIYTTLVIHVSV